MALLGVIAAASGLWFRSRLNAERREAREIRALSIGYELRNRTNSIMLVDATPEFRADLASIVSWGAWDFIDRSPPRDPWAVVRLVLTNDHAQALHMRLRDEYPSGRLRLLSYRKISPPSGAANQNQSVGSEKSSP